MDRLQRRFLACLTAIATLVAVAQGMSGMAELTLYLTPLFLIAGLLLCGRYVAEERIVRRWLGGTPRLRSRRTRGRWPAAAHAPIATRAPRSAHLERGPPALAGA